MRKKILLPEKSLDKIRKHLMTNEKKVGHKVSMPNETQVEKDEYMIGGEGGNNDYFHVIGENALNEGYCISNLSNIDLSEVGQVDYEWYFDDDEYKEWLQDNELADSEENRNEYYTEYVLYGVEYFDHETYHSMAYDQMLSYDDLEELFGEDMAKKMLQNCIEDGKGSFETYELYENEPCDINNPQEVNSFAMKILPHGDYYKGCRGFILSNGIIIYTEAEHNEVLMIPGVNSKFQFIEMGNIRLLPNAIDIGAEPTWEQERVLRQVISSYSDEELYLDIFSKSDEYGTKYTCPSYQRVLADIDRFYSEGIRPLGESKTQKSINENTFEQWFGNSVLVDKEGNPIKMYHGTEEEFDAFNKKFIGKTGAYEGYGFNFTPFESRARSYNSKNVIEAYLRAERPMTTKTHKITLSKLIKIIKELDKGKPYTDTIVAAYEPSGYGEDWDEKYYRRALPVAARTIYQYNKENGYGDAGLYAEICINGNADVKQTISAFENFGFDSAIFYDDDNRINTVVVFEPNQIKRVSNKTFSLDSEIMNENIETEVSSDDISLKSFKIKDTLPDKIWDGMYLNSRVRLKLLDIADDFWDTMNISWVKPKGIHLTGSICNYNWSKYSDIDLHIIVDFSEVDERTDFVEEYFNSKKNEWNDEHDELSIFGFKVELYVEDVNADTKSGGIYDLEENKWIKEPDREDMQPLRLDKYEVKDIAADIMTKIDDLEEDLNDTYDRVAIEKIGDDALKLLSKVKNMRKKGLERNGETDVLNIAYKVIKRAKYMDKLWDIVSKSYDEINSIRINESNSVLLKKI